jgi:hypothetical protein
VLFFRLGSLLAWSWDVSAMTVMPGLAWFCLGLFFFLFFFFGASFTSMLFYLQKHCLQMKYLLWDEGF